MKNTLFVVMVSLGLAVSSASTRADGHTENHDGLTVYSYLTPTFIQPVLDAFAFESGLPVHVEYMTAGQLLDRLVDENDAPKADVIFTMEALRLAKLVNAGVLQPVVSPALEAAIPAKYRHPDGLWFGLSKWARTAFYSKYRVDPADLQTYSDLAGDAFEGKVCVRTSNKIYVQSMLASMIANDGEAATRRFVDGLVSNFAREPIDLDLVQIQGIADGICDVAIANSYYYGRLVPQMRDPETKRILDAVGIVFLEQEGRGVHMNVSGFAMTRKTDKQDAALQLMEYMIRPTVQRLYADGSMDHPIVPGLKPHDGLVGLGDFTEDDLAIHELGAHYDLAEQISRDGNWLWK